MSTRTRNSPRKTDVARPPKPRNATARDGQPEWNVALESVLAALPQPVCVVAPDNRTVYANPAAENFFGASLNLLKRQPLDEFVAFGCPLLALIEQVRRQRSTVNEYAVEVALPRWEIVRPVDVFCGPMPDRPEYVQVTLLGRTMAQMIERQLTHRAAARSVSGLGAMLAHEIKNPLSGIRGAAQLLEPALDDSDRALTQLICVETDRIRDLVERMEVFSEDAPFTTEPVNIHDVLDRVRKIAENGFAKSVQFNEVYDPSLPPVSGSLDKLVQVFLNLVKNAAEATDAKAEGGRIILRTRFRPGVRLSVPGAGARQQLPLVIEVEDNGAGIPEDLQPMLFDPFVTSKTSGTGLGLALVAKIVGEHGGIIEFDSEPGRTVFRVLMPMYDAA
jgi:two-component system nitrogen regulation sensor histidine kinase GlnL